MFHNYTIFFTDFHLIHQDTVDCSSLDSGFNTVNIFHGLLDNLRVLTAPVRRLLGQFAGDTRQLLRMHDVLQLGDGQPLQLLLGEGLQSLGWRLLSLAHRVQDLLGEESGLGVGVGQEVAHQGALHTQHVLAHLVHLKN